MKQYYLGKLSDLNFRMAIHEGDANRRLASEIDKILLMPEFFYACIKKNIFCCHLFTIIFG